MRLKREFENMRRGAAGEKSLREAARMVPTVEHRYAQVPWGYRQAYMLTGITHRS